MRLGKVNIEYTVDINLLWKKAQLNIKYYGPAGFV